MTAGTTPSYGILVVDDDPETLTLLRTKLEAQGHRVLTASSADEALSAFLASEVHLLVVDYVMPGMDGGQLVRTIRGFDPFIQIVIQTAHVEQRPPQRVLDELDIQGFHDKADGPQRLMAWVTVCLRAHRLIQRLRDRERTQRELLSNLSHEFRAPLDVIHGYVTLLGEQGFGALAPAMRAPLDAVARNVRDLSDVIDNVLEHTRIEMGAAELTLGGIDIGPLLRELERMGGPLLAQKPVTLSVHVDPEIPIVESDAQKLRTILRNLLSNAIKFTRQGTIDVRATRVGDRLAIAVRDTGIGIAQGHLEAIFEPYRQGDGSTTRAHGGLGLGLTLSRQYARLLGGDLTVESVVGRGTLVTLMIPGVSGVRTFGAMPETGGAVERPGSRVHGAAAGPSLSDRLGELLAETWGTVRDLVPFAASVERVLAPRS